MSTGNKSLDQKMPDSGKKNWGNEMKDIENLNPFQPHDLSEWDANNSPEGSDLDGSDYGKKLPRLDNSDYANKLTQLDQPNKLKINALKKHSKLGNFTSYNQKKNNCKDKIASIKADGKRSMFIQKEQMNATINSSCNANTDRNENGSGDLKNMKKKFKNTIEAARKDNVRQENEAKTDRPIYANADNFQDDFNKLHKKTTVKGAFINVRTKQFTDRKRGGNWETMKKYIEECSNSRTKLDNVDCDTNSCKQSTENLYLAPTIKQIDMIEDKIGCKIEDRIKTISPLHLNINSKKSGTAEEKGGFYRKNARTKKIQHNAPNNTNKFTSKDFCKTNLSCANQGGLKLPNMKVFNLHNNQRTCSVDFYLEGLMASAALDSKNPNETNKTNENKRKKNDYHENLKDGIFYNNDEYNTYLDTFLKTTNKNSKKGKQFDELRNLFKTERDHIINKNKYSGHDKQNIVHITDMIDKFSLTHEHNFSDILRSEDKTLKKKNLFNTPKKNTLNKFLDKAFNSEDERFTKNTKFNKTFTHDNEILQIDTKTRNNNIFLKF